MKKLFALFLLSIPTVTAAQYSTLIQSPLNSEGGLSEFLNDVYLIVISATALFAVVKIIIAGVKYMLADIPGSKQDAKNDIRTALFGLIIIVSAVLILRTINPNLTTFSLKFQKPEQRVDTSAVVVEEDGSVSTSTAAKRPAPIRYNMEDYGTWEWDDILPEHYSLHNKYSRDVGNIRIYNWKQQCREEKSEENYAEQEENCFDAITDLFYEEGNAIDNEDNWCQDSGGRKAQTSIEGTIACELPTRFISRSDVNSKRSELNLDPGLSGYQSACSNLGGSAVYDDRISVTSGEDRAENYICVSYD